MRQILLLTFLSFLAPNEVFIKSATGQSSTYEDLCGTFSIKAQQTLEIEKTKLDKLFKGKTILWHVELLPLFSICEPGLTSEIIASLDHIVEINAKTISLTSNILSLKSKRVTMDALCDNIKSHLTLNSTSSQIMPADIENVYSTWRNDYLKQIDLKRVAINLKKLKEKHGQFNQPFTNEWLLVNQAKAAFQKESNAIFLAFTNTVLNGINGDGVAEIKKVKGIFLNYTQIQAEMIKHLSEAVKILEEFNIRREMWAKFLVGVPNIKI
ncbi:uncharacterized protein LOC116347329 [Contarinia nasturtii]|uniref:uncharacterized protein LOC116347329 n=1 Tax=Contarinia nasturtii TaxID=265458 RepID=UPI0012D373F2|nr:uncharacterized protein LOC116347329 [Contarinia nasturtii]